MGVELCRRQGIPHVAATIDTNARCALTRPEDVMWMLSRDSKADSYISELTCLLPADDPTMCAGLCTCSVQHKALEHCSTDKPRIAGSYPGGTHIGMTCVQVLHRPHLSSSKELLPQDVTTPSGSSGPCHSHDEIRKFALDSGAAQWMLQKGGCNCITFVARSTVRVRRGAADSQTAAENAVAARRRRRIVLMVHACHSGQGTQHYCFE